MSGGGAVVPAAEALRVRPDLSTLTRRAVVYLDFEGVVQSGAAAVYCFRAESGGSSWAWSLYRKNAFFRGVSETGYRCVAFCRPALSRLADLLFGPPVL